MSNTSPVKPKVTFWHMWRDIFVAAINKGQFLTAILGLLLLVIVWRLPSEELSAITKDVVNSLKSGYLVGYALFALALLGWFAHAKSLRTIATTEQKRIGNEKSELQKRAGLGNRVRSSKKK